MGQPLNYRLKIDEKIFKNLLFKKSQVHVLNDSIDVKYAEAYEKLKNKI